MVAAERGAGLPRRRLGPHVLRAETAAITAGALLAALRAGLVHGTAQLGATCVSGARRVPCHLVYGRTGCTRSDCPWLTSVRRVGGRSARRPSRTDCLGVAVVWGPAEEDQNDGDRRRGRARQRLRRKVGERLRSIRRQKRLSLQDVEAASEHEFKASVLGAYERGERAISVPRLQRLARFYRVPVDQLLPSDDELGIRRPTATSRSSTSPSACVGPAATTVRSRSTSAPSSSSAGRRARCSPATCAMIQVQRRDYNGRMLTIRRDDLRAIACILDCHPDQVPARLDSLGLCLVR